MDKFVIRGGNPLLGTVRISGAKNAALPAMAAALLTDETVVLENIPDVRDIETELTKHQPMHVGRRKPEDRQLRLF